LGLSLACQLAQRGAHVSIVSRSQGKLDKALLEIEVRKEAKVERERLVAHSQLASFP